MYNQVKIKLYLRLSLKPNDWCLQKRKRRFGYRDIEETQEEDGAMTEAETEVMQLQAKEEAIKDPLLEPSEGAWPADTLYANFQPPEL